jgi:magnesium-transporting ATPase (P-type)
VNGLVELTNKLLDLSRFQGLSAQEAERRFRDEGPNELPSRETRDVFVIIAEVIREPFAVINGDDFYGRHSFEVLARAKALEAQGKEIIKIEPGFMEKS